MVNDTPLSMVDKMRIRNKWYQAVEMIFFVTGISAFIAMGIMQFMILSSVKTKADSTNRHMDCIVAFFSNPNRTHATIEDINKCSIKVNQ